MISVDPRTGAGGDESAISSVASSETPERSRGVVLDLEPPGHQHLAERRGVGAVLRVVSESQARALCVEILCGDRDYPIVGLTCRAGVREPALPVERVRERVWPGAPIYVIEPRESRIVNGLLPDGLGAYNGAARVWWPGVDRDSEASWHPLIYDRAGVYGEEALERIAREFSLKAGETAVLSEREQAALRLRAVPRPTGQDTGRSTEVARIVGLATRKDLRRLTGELRRGDRDVPVVVLSFAEGAREPAFSPTAVCRALDPRVAVYVLGSEDLCRRLAQILGPRLGVDGGDARIYWPGVGSESDPDENPLVLAKSDLDSREPVVRLIEALELSRPDISRHVKALRERLSAAEQRACETLFELRESRAVLTVALAGAGSAETALAVAEQQLEALRRAGLDETELELLVGMDGDARLHRLISREWLGAMASAAERREFPPGGYVFGERFLESVQRLTGTRIDRIAWACAMVASGRAKSIPGLEPHHLRARSSGSAGQLVRADGAKAWICRLLGDGASRLHYWARVDGITEFATVATHDEIGRL